MRPEVGSLETGSGCKSYEKEYLYIEDDQIDLEIQEDMLVIISLIADINQKELVATNLIDILIFYLKDLPGKVVNGIRRQQLLLSVIDCIFSAILGYEDAEIKFLELEGAFLLIGKARSSAGYKMRRLVTDNQLFFKICWTHCRMKCMVLC